MADFFDAQRWFEVREMADGIDAIGEPLHPEHVRSYLVAGSEQAVLIDTGTGIGDIRAVVDELTLLPVKVINSHAHWDHIGGNWRFGPVAIHPDEVLWLSDPSNTVALQASSKSDQLRGPLPPGVVWEELTIPDSEAGEYLSGGELLDLGGVELEVIHAPGHSPGLLVFLDRERGILLSTDAVYPGPLYAYHDDTNLDDYVTTLDRLTELSSDLQLVLPCHSGDSLDPALIPHMRDAMVAVRDGRAAELVDAEKATHQFDHFAIYAPLELQRMGSAR